MVSTRHVPRGAVDRGSRLQAQARPQAQEQERYQSQEPGPDEEHTQIAAPRSKKVSREMQRLMIDANPSLGGAANSSSGSSRRRRQTTTASTTAAAPAATTTLTPATTTSISSTTDHATLPLPPSPPPSQTTSSPAKDRPELSVALSPGKLAVEVREVHDDALQLSLPSPAADRPAARTAEAITTAAIPPIVDLPAAHINEHPLERTSTPAAAKGQKRTLHDYFGKARDKTADEQQPKRRKVEVPCIKPKQSHELERAQSLDGTQKLDEAQRSDKTHALDRTRELDRVQELGSPREPDRAAAALGLAAAAAIGVEMPAQSNTDDGEPSVQHTLQAEDANAHEAVVEPPVEEVKNFAAEPPLEHGTSQTIHNQDMISLDQNSSATNLSLTDQTPDDPAPVEPPAPENAPYASAPLQSAQPGSAQPESTPPKSAPSESDTTNAPAARKPIKVTREMRRLQIDANAKILGATGAEDTATNTRNRRRQTDLTALEATITAPPPPPKRIRHSLPGPAPPPKPALPSEPIVDPTTLIPKPFDLTDQEANRTRPPILPNGGINPVWLDSTLAFICDITGDHDTRDILLAQAAEATIIESQADRQRRLHDEAKMIRDWPLLSVEETAQLREKSDAIMDDVDAVVQEKLNAAAAPDLSANA
ncbi:hypothetical protein MBLNU459_g4996t1 [Dothideomycetes sp. NU459]